MCFNLSLNREASEFYTEKQLGTLEESLHTDFRDKTLLIKALSHRSPLKNPLTSKDENKRLGLIGDKLIDLVLFEKLYREGASPEKMDDARKKTSKKPALSAAARRLGLKPYLFYNDGTEDRVKEESKSIFEDSFEAIVGAIYIDQGFKKAVNFVQERLLSA